MRDIDRKASLTFHNFQRGLTDPDVALCVVPSQYFMTDKVLYNFRSLSRCLFEIMLYVNITFLTSTFSAYSDRGQPEGGAVNPTAYGV